MPRLLAGALLLALPFLALLGLERLLPNDAFTFRAWEALEVRGRVVDTPLVRLFPWTTLPGPFLPGVRLARSEQGDLGHHGPQAVDRAVVWETDAHGFRASPDPAAIDLVLVGDSAVVGTGLSQADTLAAVLRARHGIAAYPYAPAGVADFLAEPRFRDRPPALLVLECVEREVLDDFQERPMPRPKPREVRVVESAPLRRFEVEWNRLRRQAGLRWLRARIDGRPPPVARGGLLFRLGAGALAASPPERVRAAADALAWVDAEARARGLRFVVLVVPEKETIYADLFPEARPPGLLAELQQALQARGVEAIDLEGPFRAARARGEPPFLSDDTHWSAAGVAIAGGLIAAWAQPRHPVLGGGPP